ncbi:MAG: redoxin domain-containing protein [Dysgonomonas sp.]
MKYINIILLIILLPLIHSCNKSSKENGDNFCVNGVLENLNSPYFFIAMESSDSIKVDTVFVDDKGKFSYQGKAEKLTMASLYFIQKSWTTSIFLDKNSTIEIKGDINHPDLIIVSGGPVNDDLTSFKKNNAALFRNRSDILHQMLIANNPEIKHNLSTDLKNVNFDLTNKARIYIENNPEKIASVILIQDFYKNYTSLDILEEELNKLTGAAAEFSVTQDLKKYVAEAKLSSIGAKAPNLELKGGSKPVLLDSFKGKYILLSIVSQDSNIYNKSLPVMTDIYNKLRNKNIQFISVVVDSTQEMKAKEKVKWQVYYDKKGWAAEAIKLFNITEIPYHILISPDGTILDRGLAINSLPEKLIEFQKEADK